MIILWGGFTESLVANLVAGVVILGITVLVVNIWLYRRDQRREKVQRRKAALGAVKWELEWNQGNTDQVLKSRKPLAALYSVSGWDLVNQESVFSTLDPDTILTLSQIYAAFRWLNEANRNVAELFYGASPTEIEFALRQGDSLEELRPEFKKSQAKSFTNLTDLINEMLYWDVENPEGSINAALTHVDHELDREEPPWWRRLLG